MLYGVNNLRLVELNADLSGLKPGGFNEVVITNASAVAGRNIMLGAGRLSAAYEGVFRAFRKHHASVDMVTFWGPNDANSWRRRGTPLLFDVDGKPKPAFDAVIRIAQGEPSSVK